MIDEWKEQITCAISGESKLPNRAEEVCVPPYVHIYIYIYIYICIHISPYTYMYSLIFMCSPLFESNALTHQPSGLDHQPSGLGPKAGLEFEQFLVWQRRILLFC